MIRQFNVNTALLIPSVGALTNTAAIPVQFAHGLTIYVKNTGAATLQGVSAQQSYNGGSTWNTIDAGLTDSVNSAANLAANVTGVFVINTKAVTPHFGATHVRLQIQGNAGASPTNDSTVNVDAAVAYDLNGPSNP